MIKKVFLVLLIMLYVFAGVNHFWHPSFYLRIIPPYLPNHKAINILAGCAELIFGTMLMLTKSRRWAAIGIIAMLVAFIPSHVYSLQLAETNPQFHFQFAIAWIRFFIIHPFLIAWAWWCRK